MFSLSAVYCSKGSGGSSRTGSYRGDLALEDLGFRVVLCGRGAVAIVGSPVVVGSEGTTRSGPVGGASRRSPSPGSQVGSPAVPLSTSWTRRRATLTRSPSISVPTNRRPSPTVATAAGTVPGADAEVGDQVAGVAERLDELDRLVERLLPLVHALLRGLATGSGPGAAGASWACRRASGRGGPDARRSGSSRTIGSPPSSPRWCRRSASGTPGPPRRARPGTP